MNFILLLAVHYLKIRIIDFNNSIKNETITPSDFTVLATNLPLTMN